MKYILLLALIHHHIPTPKTCVPSHLHHCVRPKVDEAGYAACIQRWHPVNGRPTYDVQRGNCDFFYRQFLPDDRPVDRNWLTGPNDDTPQFVNITQDKR